MKKIKLRGLKLKKETLRALSPDEMGRAAGAYYYSQMQNCSGSCTCSGLTCDACGSIKCM